MRHGAAPHRCRFASPELDLSGRGELQEVTVTFAGPAPALLDGARWWHSTARGAAGGDVGGAKVQLQSCSPSQEPARPTRPAARRLPWLEVRLPTDAGALDADALTAVFSDVTLTVRVEALPADAAYAGDAKLDTEKEFQPFGPVPRRGDVFHMVSEEAFAKPLGRLGVELAARPQARRHSPGPLRRHRQSRGPRVVRTPARAVLHATRTAVAAPGRRALGQARRRRKLAREPSRGHGAQRASTRSRHPRALLGADHPGWQAGARRTRGPQRRRPRLGGLPGPARPVRCRRGQQRAPCLPRT